MAHVPRLLRRLSSCAIMAGLLASAARGGELEIIRVWPGWREASSFERIGEYFGRPENNRREVVLRSQRAEREGYYFLVRVKSPEPVPAAQFELQVIRPDAPQPKRFTFPVAVPAKQTVFQLGLTGPDWPGGKIASPIAWRLALVSGDGRLLAEQKSFLWEKPAK